MPKNLSAGAGAAARTRVWVRGELGAGQASPALRHDCGCSSAGGHRDHLSKDLQGSSCVVAECSVEESLLPVAVSTVAQLQVGKELALLRFSRVCENVFQRQWDPSLQ